MEMWYVFVLLIIGSIVSDVPRASSSATNLQTKDSLKALLMYQFERSENDLPSRQNEEDQKVMEKELAEVKIIIQDCLLNEQNNYTSQRKDTLQRAITCTDQDSKTTGTSTSLETCKSTFSEDLEKLKKEHADKVKQCIQNSLCTMTYKD